MLKMLSKDGPIAGGKIPLSIRRPPLKGYSFDFCGVNSKPENAAWFPNQAAFVSGGQRW